MPQYPKKKQVAQILMLKKIKPLNRVRRKRGIKNQNEKFKFYINPLP
jgi:hypothetical protein